MFNLFFISFGDMVTVVEAAVTDQMSANGSGMTSSLLRTILSL